MNDALIKFTPDVAVLFAIGVLAAGVVTASERTRSRPWAGFALAASIPVVVLIMLKGSTWTNNHLFWADLAWGPAIACLLAAVATSRPRLVVRFLNTRPLRSLGSFSYSLYLTHAPIVIAVSYGLILGHVAAGTPPFLVLTAILLPVTVCFARLLPPCSSSRSSGTADGRRCVVPRADGPQTFSATTANLRTRPVPSQSLQS